MMPYYIYYKMSAKAVHTSARSQKNPKYPPRGAVTDGQVPWSTKFAEYKPVEYEDAVLEGAPWADAADFKSISAELIRKRVSAEGAMVLDKTTGRPLNPRGRTGITGRGLLGKWGPNFAADPIVTRFHPTEGQLQVVVIERRDTGDWALPGGMVDPGEHVSVTVRREFTEEAGNLASDPEKAALFKKLTDDLFADGNVVYTGYVDDPRNTDNAWMETTAMHFACNSKLGEMMPLKAGDDAAKVRLFLRQHMAVVAASNYV